MSRINIGAPDDDANEIVLDYATVDQGVGFTKRLFGYTEPYKRFVNIFGDVTYTWDKDFIDMLVVTLNTGIYDNKFNAYEKKIAEDYVSFKYENNLENLSEVIVFLDKHMGEL